MQTKVSRGYGINAGGVDWPARWRAKAEAKLALRGAEELARGAAHWDDRADRFAGMARALDVDSDPLAVAIRSATRPTDRVLDIGAGAGRYTFAIAPLVERVTAVEPSRGMRSALRKDARARGLENVAIVGTTWESAEVEPHDVSLVSSVLYFVVDGAEFLDKLDRCTTRACYIFHRVEERASALGELWRELAADRPKENSFLDLYNLLFSMGIRANARVVRTGPSGRYADLDEACADARQLLDLHEVDPPTDARIRSYLSDTLVASNGKLQLPRGADIGIIWWEKGE